MFVLIAVPRIRHPLELSLCYYNDCSISRCRSIAIFLCNFYDNYNLISNSYAFIQCLQNTYDLT